MKRRGLQNTPSPCPPLNRTNQPVSDAILPGRCHCSSPPHLSPGTPSPTDPWAPVLSELCFGTWSHLPHWLLSLTQAWGHWQCPPSHKDHTVCPHVPGPRSAPLPRGITSMLPLELPTYVPHLHGHTSSQPSEHLKTHHCNPSTTETIALQPFVAPSWWPAALSFWSPDPESPGGSFPTLHLFPPSRSTADQPYISSPTCTPALGPWSWYPQSSPCWSGSLPAVSSRCHQRALPKPHPMGPEHIETSCRVGPSPSRQVSWLTKQFHILS